MINSIDKLISSRISELYRQFTYFCDDEEDNMSNYFHGLNHTERWLTLLTTIAVIEISTNTKATLESYFIATTFNEEYELDQDYSSIDFIYVNFSNNSKVINHFESNSEKYLGISLIYDEEQEILIISNE